MAKFEITFLKVVTLLLLITFSFEYSNLTPILERSMKKNEPVSCDSVSFFSNSKRSGLNNVVPNTSDFCPNLIRTCCDGNDFNNIKNWWQVDKNGFKSILRETRFEARKRKEEMILVYTTELINWYLQLKDAAKSIIKNQNADISCKAASRNF